MRSSPTRSPRRCSTAPASPSPATPNFSPGSPQEHTGRAVHPVMMLWSPELAVVPVTIHLPLRDVPQRAHHRPDRRDRPHRRARSARRASASRGRALRSPASIRMPAKTARSATRTAPWSRRRSSGCAPRASTRAGRCRPTPCSTPRRARSYDAALAMYHDQALIPIKTLAFDHAVNVTLGLPFVRTSPDHGTAFDIAGTGRANPASLVAALQARGAARSAPTRWRAAQMSADRRPAAAARGHPAPRARRAQIARPEFPARSQSHRPHRARRGPARRRHGDRGRPGPGRADARAAGRRRRTRDRDRARRARDRGARRRSPTHYPGRLTIVPATRSTSTSRRISAARPGARRRQPALQHRDRAADRAGSPPSPGRRGTTGSC